MIDDRFNINLKKVKLHYPSVGGIITNTQKKNLSFREACNKIIHANSVHLNTKYDNVNQTEILDEYITLHGNIGKTLWTVIIDIEKYVVNGLCMTKIYDDDWDLSSR